jgi:O-antigen/teichoic acid export membrane protein
VSNTSWSILSYAIYLPVNLLVARYMVEKLGVGGFGVWAALTTVMAFSSLLDLGVTSPVMKYVSEYNALGMAERVNTVVSTAMLFYLIVSVAFSIVMITAGGWVLVHLFHTQAQNQALREMYDAVIVGFAISLTFSVLQSLLTGLQRADVQANLGLVYNLAGAAGTVLVLALGLGLQGLAANWLAFVLIAIAGNWAAAKHYFPPLRLNPLLFRWTEMKRILSFSTKVQASTVALFMNNQVDRILITYALGPTILGFYQLAARAATSLTGFSSALSNAVLPASSELSTTDQWDRLKSLYIRATRYQAMMLFPLCAAMCGLAFPLIYVWLGPGFDRTSVTMILLAGSYAVWLPNGATVATLNGVGHPEVRMRADIILVLIHVPLAAFLIWRFGYYGTVAATSSLLVISRLYIFAAGGRYLRTSLANIGSAVLHPAVGSLSAMGAVIAVQVIIKEETLLILAVECLIFCAVYLGYMVLWGFDPDDVSLLKMVASRILPLRRLPQP